MNKYCEHTRGQYIGAQGVLPAPCRSFPSINVHFYIKTEPTESVISPFQPGFSNVRVRPHGCAPRVLAVWWTSLKAMSETRVTRADDVFCRSVSVPSTQHTWRWSSDCNSTHWLSLCQKQISGSGSITSPKQTPNSLLSVVVPADMTYAIKAVRNTPV